MIAALLAALAVNAAPGAPCIQFGPGRDPSFTPVDRRTLLVEQGGSAFRITVAEEPLLIDPQSQVVTVVRGISRACRPADLRLRVLPQPTPAGGVGLVVQAITPIGGAEARALRAGRR